jgi:exosortase
MKKPLSDEETKCGTSGWRMLALPAFVLLCWGLVVHHLSSEWTLNEQYHYGWIVPLLALYLLRLRLENKPCAIPVRRSWAIAGGVLLIAMAEVVLLPVQLANSDWRLLGWTLTGLATVATWLMVAQVGGLPWVLHLAFPVLFFFTAVPLPHPLENEIMQWLMQRNARLAAEFLHWWGVEAEVQGNLIRLASATVGISEACSGIRSLQGTLMMSLFVGEIFGLKRWRRLWLLLAGAGCALVSNTARTLFLCLMTERGGIEAHDRWHDSAGLWGLAGCVAGVTLVGWLLSRNQRCSVTVPRTHGWNWIGRLAASSSTALFGIILIFAAWGAAEAWFRVQEASVTRLSGWRFKQPTAASGFESVEQTKAVRAELRYDFHSGGAWLDADGRRWVAHYFRWDPGRNALGAIRVHDPRVCRS